MKSLIGKMFKSDGSIQMIDEVPEYGSLNKKLKKGVVVSATKLKERKRKQK